MQLHRAAIEGRTADLRRLLAQKGEFHVDSLTDAGLTPLLAACRCSADARAECVRVLLAAGADPSICDARGVSPLHDACRRGDLEIVQLLCGAGASPDTRNNDGESAHDVATRMDPAAGVPCAANGASRLLGDLGVAPLLCAEVAFSTASVHCGRPGVALAYDRSRNEYMVALMDSDEVVRAQPRELRRMPWGWAVRRRDPIIGVGRSSQHGAAPVGSAPPRDSDASDGCADGQTGGRGRDVKRAEPPEIGMRPCRGERHSVSGAGISVRAMGSPSGRLYHTPLAHQQCARARVCAAFTPSRSSRRHWAPEATFATSTSAEGGEGASDHGSVMAASSCSRSAGGDLKRRIGEHWRMEERERSALHAACAQGHIALVRRLLACGSAVGFAIVSSGETALHVACEAGVPEVVRLLLDASASTHVRNHAGDAPLHCAAWSGEEEILSLLIDTRAAVEMAGHRGNGGGAGGVSMAGHRGETPLHVAATRGHEAAVRLLIDEGDADVDAKDEEGATPLLSASMHGAPPAVSRLLRQRGASPLPADAVTILRRLGEGERSGCASDLEPALSEAWLERAQRLLPLSRRLLVFGDLPSRFPAQAILMEGTLSSMSADRLDRWRQTCATFRGRQAVMAVPAALDRAACAALRHAVDTRGSISEDTVDLLPNHDFPMRIEELEALIGMDATRRLFRLAETFHRAPQPAPGRIFARRYSANGDDQPWTSFHQDAAHTTINVALTDDAGFGGGDLLGLFDGAVGRLPRTEGDATVHTSSLMHGVTRMTSGVRYSLIMYASCASALDPSAVQICSLALPLSNRMMPIRSAPVRAPGRFVPGDADGLEHQRPRKYIFPAGSCASRGFF